MKQLRIEWQKRNIVSMLVERTDIILWLRQFFTSIRKFRAERWKIYCLDERRVNAGHTKTYVWIDTIIAIARQAFVEAVTIGLKNPLGKSKCLIVLHISTEDGFVQNALLLFESKKSEDYHEEMNGEVKNTDG